MTDRYILNDDGEPEPCEDFLTWAAWLETSDRRVAHDMDEGPGAEPVAVSTVFLGLDYGTSYLFPERKLPPVLWESLVFGGPLDKTCRRYTSRAEALAGHQDLCRQVAAAKTKAAP